MPDSSHWIQFGYILKAHGVRGELRLIPQGDIPFPSKLKNVRLVSKAGKAAEYSVGSVREVHDAYLLTLKEVSGRDAAAALKGWTVQIPHDALPSLGAGEYYLFELIGAAVHSSNGEALGEVANLFDNAGQTLLEINTDPSKRLLPAVPETVVSFDRDKKLLVVTVPEGLWEDG